ncbi:MAG: hypothetical protein LBI84_05375 [Propionibacteriaceae bacterium]|jgi:hypothetical protein|nr:hypothetical protein [Propionibacteriaceae bacterium]
MIIWRGWGVLAIFIPAACAAGLAALFGSSGRTGFWTDVGLTAGGVICYFVGRWLNVTRPDRQLAASLADRAAELHADADSGVFSLGPGYAPPTSLAEAHAQADQLASAEYEAWKKNARRRHSLFWVPIQYWGLVLGVGGVLVIIFTLATGR